MWAQIALAIGYPEGTGNNRTRAALVSAGLYQPQWLAGLNLRKAFRKRSKTDGNEVGENNSP